MSDQWGAPDGGSGGTFKPFDRQALEASLADALKDASEADEVAGAASGPAPEDARRPEPAAPAASTGSAPAGPVRAPNPFGRPNAPVGSGPASAPAPLPSTAAVAPRTGPSILSGGISGLSPGGGLGASVSGFRPPDGGGYGLSNGGLGSAGLGPRPLGPLGGVSAEEPPEPAATIALRRPNRPDAPAEPAPEPAPAARTGAAAQPALPMAGWMPADDDILPRAANGRRQAKAPKVAKTKAPKEPKLKLRKG